MVGVDSSIAQQCLYDIIGLSVRKEISQWSVRRLARSLEPVSSQVTNDAA